MLASYATADPSVAKSLRGTGTTVRRQPDARVTNFELGSRSDCDPKSQDMHVLGRTLLRNKSVVVYARIIFGHIRDLPLDISPCVSCQPSCLKSRSHRSNWTELNWCDTARRSSRHLHWKENWLELVNPVQWALGFVRSGRVEASSLRLRRFVYQIWCRCGSKPKYLVGLAPLPISLPFLLLSPLRFSSSTSPPYLPSSSLPFPLPLSSLFSPLPRPPLRSRPLIYS